MAKTNKIQSTQKVKEPAGAPPHITLQQIQVRKWVRTEQDIPKWRNAIKSFESLNPRRRLLYNLYADVELDGHVQSVTSKRKDAVTRAKWQFLDKEGKPVDEVNELIDSLGFDDLVNEIIASKFWGYSILEPRFWKGVDDTWEMSAGLLPRLHYMPEKGILTYDSVGDAGINIREGIYLKTMIEVGDVKDMGLYAVAAAYQILKRGGVGDYAAFIQTFGNPIIDALWDGVDLSKKEQLQTALDGIGAGGNIIRPDGTEINIIENRTKDTSDAHGSFLGFLNKEISKALLGSTETTEASNASGYAQSKTHAEEDDDKHETDISFTRKVLNSRFIRVIQAAGFDTRGGTFSVKEEDKKLSKKETFEILKGAIKELNLPVEDDFIYETLNFPKPDDYDKRKAEMEEAQTAAIERSRNGSNPGDPGKEPKANSQQPTASSKPKAQSKKSKSKKPSPDKEEQPIELAWYKKVLGSFFVKAPQDGAACARHTIKLAEGQDIDNEALLKRVWTSGGTLKEDAELYGRTAQILEEGFLSGWNEQPDSEQLELADKFNFEYGKDDPEYLKSFLDSIFKFTGSKVTALLEVLNRIFRESVTFDEFYQSAREETEIFNVTYLEAEYTTAVLTGQAASTYKRLKSQTDIFPYWFYRTAGDELVRNSHRLLEDLVLAHDDPAWEKLFPPNGWRCRCYIVPRMAHEVTPEQLEQGKRAAKQYLESPAYEKEKKAGWATDRMGEGFVFGREQYYSVDNGEQ